MDETYDEFSELVAATSILPPSASRVVAAAHEAVHDETDENLEQPHNHGEDDDADTFGEYGDGEGQNMYPPSVDGETVVVNANDDEENFGFLEDVDDEAAQDDELPDEDDEDDEDDDDEEEEHATDGAGPASPSPSHAVEESHHQQQAPQFALSRIKQLFKFAHAMSRESVPSMPQCILSTDAATVVAEVTALMLKDLATAAVAETQRREKKTVSYDDVSFVVSQLDRFSFLSDMLPLPSGGVSTRPVAPRRSAVTASSSAENAPAPTTSRKSANTPKPKPAAPSSSAVNNHKNSLSHGDGKRQLTLHFGSR